MMLLGLGLFVLQSYRYLPFRAIHGNSLRDASIPIIATHTHGKGPTRAMMTMIHKSSDLEEQTNIHYSATTMGWLNYMT